MDEITRKWFDVSTVRVTRAPELNGWYSDAELVRLSGAPKDSHLDVAPTSDGRIELRVSNADLLNKPLVRSVSQAANGGYVFEIQNAAFVLRPAFRGQGIGTRSVAMELHEARRLGDFSTVWVSAVGDWSSLDGPMAMNGYYVWARMGFNARLPEDLLSHPCFPGGAGDGQDLNGLLRTSEGEDFWLHFGRSLRLEFRLQDPSDSWARLRHYEREHDIEVTP